MPYPYSEEENQRIAALYQKGLGVCAIAKKLKHDPRLVSQTLRDQGVWIRGSRNFTNAEEVEIGKIYSVGGFSTKAIARAYGLGHHISICAALKRQGIKQRPKAERNRLYNLDPYVFDTINTEKKAYWLGFLYADGHIHRRSLILMLKATDISQLEKFKRFMKSESPIKEIEVATSGKKYPTVKIEHTEKHLASRLKELGIVKGRGSFNKLVGGIPFKLRNHFIRGYFDGDGCAYKNSVSFCGQPDILEWIRAVLASEADTNPNLSIKKHRNANAYYLNFSGRIQALNVASFLYKEATVWLERKKNVISSWPEPKPRVRNEKGQFV